MAKQTKTKQMNLRVTEDFMEVLSARASAAGVSRSAYICRLVEQDALASKVAGDGAAVAVYRDEDLNRIVWHLAHWGNNLNQSTNALNKLAKSGSLNSPRALAALEMTAMAVDDAKAAVVAMEKAVYQMKEERLHIVSGGGWSL